MSLALGSCRSNGIEYAIAPGGNSAPIARISIATRATSLIIGDSVALTAYGHQSNGDSTIVAANWSSSIGTVASGWFRASAAGAGALHATSLADPSQGDSTAVAIASVELAPSDTLVGAGESVQVNPQAILPDGSIMTPAVTWSATGGTVSPTGLYSAPDDPGTYVVMAQLTGHAASASLRMRVTPPTLRALVLNPVTVAMLAGATRQFSVAALWSNGSQAVPTIAWSVTGGSITAGGLYTAPAAAGLYRVFAAAGSLTDTADVTVSVPAPTADQVTISPKAVALATGATSQYGATVLWSDGSSSITGISYAATGGTISPNGLYIAGSTAGSYRVIATHQASAKADTATVTITAPAITLVALVLNPKAVTLAPGATQQFSVAAAWSDGSSVPPPLVYSATGGPVSSGGLYTAGSTPGIYRVIAAQQGGTKADTATVTVAVPPATLTKVTILPKSVTLATGATQQFNVAGTWSDGSSAVPAVTYSATGGSITSAGLYTAGATPGTYRVIAAQIGGSKADTSTVTAALPPATLTKLTLSPKSLTLVSGSRQQFAAAGTWSNGSSTPPLATYSATGGTITPTGLYTAGTVPGSFRIIATQQGGTQTDTATVTIPVPPPTLTTLVLNPKSLALQFGATQQFTVAGSWSDGSSTAPTVSYSAAGGTITAGGLYSAGTTAGTFRLIATQQGGSKSDTAIITVTSSEPTTLALVTQPGGAVSGAPLTQQPIVELRNSQNLPVQRSGIAVTTSLSNGSGILAGSVTATTNAQGRAIFTSLQITGAGEYTLAFSAPGLDIAVSHTVAVLTPSLRTLAAARGLLIGTAVVTDAGTIGSDSLYLRTVSEQFGFVTPNNAMLFSVVHPKPAQYDFSAADRLVAFAQGAGIVVKGHALVWGGGALPSWISAGTFTRTQLLAVLKDHIRTVVSRYAGKVTMWNVVNEPISWDGRSGLQPSVWLNTIGPEFIDSAFVWAHQADPGAKLYLNEFGAEGLGQKADSLLALALRLKTRGIPIDGVGLQAHAFPQTPLADATSFRANLARFARAGFDVQISELDVMIPDMAGDGALLDQAISYRDYLDACLLQPRCVGFTTWGFTDRYSWIPRSWPGYGRGLPLDSNYRAKPAFDSLAARLRRR